MHINPLSIIIMKVYIVSCVCRKVCSRIVERSTFMNGGNFEVNNVGHDRWICVIDRSRCANDGSIVRTCRDRYIAYCKHYPSCDMASKPVYIPYAM